MRGEWQAHGFIAQVETARACGGARARGGCCRWSVSPAERVECVFVHGVTRGIARAVEMADAAIESLRAPGDP